MGPFSSTMRGIDDAITFHRNNPGQVNPNDKEFASKTYANLVYSQWEDYLARFNPYEKRTMDLAESKELLNQQLSRVTTNVNNSFSTPNMNAGALQQRRYGITDNAEQSTASGNKRDMNQALSMAHGKNNTRVANQDMRMGLVTGSDSTRQTAIRQTQGGGY